MLRRELRKKIQAVVMAAIVTFTTVGAPAVTFADEFSSEVDVSQFSDGGEASEEDNTGDDLSDGTDIAVYSDTGEHQTAAQEYLKTNFIGGNNKII